MKIGVWNVRRRVVVGVLCGVVAFGAGSLWMKRTQPAVVAGSGPGPEPFLRVGGNSDGNLLKEQAIFADPTPLFFPTPQNFGQGRAVPALLRQPGEEFKNFEPSYQFPVQRLKTYGLENEPLPERPEDVLGRGDLAPFAGFGESGKSVELLVGRRGYIRIKSLINGTIGYERPLDESALAVTDFAPVEYLVAVVSGGLLGEPLLVSSSGSEQVDNSVRDYLVKSLRIGAILEPGKYAVSVGP